MQSEEVNLWLVTDVHTRVIVGMGMSQNQNLKWSNNDDRNPLGKPRERYDINKTVGDITIGTSSESEV